MSGRGMKKWAPFSSLVEQSSTLKKAKMQKEKVDKPILSEDEIEDINYKLSNYDGSEIVLKYYKNGQIFESVTQILQINLENLTIKTSDGIVSFTDILDISENK